MSTLILVRHGETEGNVAKRLDTRLPGAPLTELGVEQAKSVGERLGALRPSALFSSQALRARQTAGYIGAATGLTARAVEGLQEAHAGELEDRTDEPAHELFKSVFRAWHAGDLTAAAPGGESGNDVLARYVPVLDGLRAEYFGASEDSTVVVVGHGAAIRLVGRVLGAVPGEFASRNHLDNAATIELRATDGGWECVRWGSFTPPFIDAAGTQPDDPMG